MPFWRLVQLLLARALDKLAFLELILGSNCYISLLYKENAVMCMIEVVMLIHITLSLIL